MSPTGHSSKGHTRLHTTCAGGHTSHPAAPHAGQWSPPHCTEGVSRWSPTPLLQVCWGSSNPTALYTSRCLSNPLHQVYGCSPTLLYHMGVGTPIPLQHSMVPSFTFRSLWCSRLLLLWHHGLYHLLGLGQAVEAIGNRGNPKTLTAVVATEEKQQ